VESVVIPEVATSYFKANFVAKKMCSRLPGFCLNHLPANLVSEVPAISSGLRPTQEILAVRIHICGIPKKETVLIQFVEELEALLVRLCGAITCALRADVSNCTVNVVWMSNLPSPWHRSLAG
jgi:hypothetical protein